METLNSKRSRKVIRKTNPVESLELFQTDDIIRNDEDIMSIILKSGEVDRGDGRAIREAVALVMRKGSKLVPEDFPGHDFARLQAGQSVSFTSMCRMLSSLGLRLKVEKAADPED